MTQESNQYGFRFNGHHSSEFSVYVVYGSETEGYPAKTKDLVTLPGSSQVLDLSNLYGPVYGERTKSLTLVLAGEALLGREQMTQAWTRVINWLMKPDHKVVYQSDLMPEYHYLAEVQNAPSLSEVNDAGQLTIEFQCYSFRIKNKPEFDDIWDDFNFDTGVAQETHYIGSTSTPGVLINTGVAEVPTTVKASEAVTLIINSEQYELQVGDNSSTELVLMPGENDITIRGSTTAKVDFSWYQEVI
ncbi:hypothetical protein [Lapidilactobacillus wuchangensis]|uniref:hypothetical protein n=1 Tax=Lapidilactobacillus wuchangensis TaxID=2486001 RepID=UPI000F780C76|nr:hypothetical protein [Lapidilactobacillus wuchangensis]